MDRPKEKEIIALLQDPERQREAFEQVVQKYSETLYWQIRRLILSHEDANDILRKIGPQALIDAVENAEAITAKAIRSMDEINEAIDEFNIKIAVIAVPGSVSQEVCDRLMEPRKIKAVWNFAPNHLQVPKGVILQNENIAASLSVLSKRLMDQEYMEAQGQEHEDEDEDLGPRTRF